MPLVLETSGTLYYIRFQKLWRFLLLSYDSCTCTRNKQNKEQKVSKGQKNREENSQTAIMFLVPLNFPLERWALKAQVILVTLESWSVVVALWSHILRHGHFTPSKDYGTLKKVMLSFWQESMHSTLVMVPGVLLLFDAWGVVVLGWKPGGNQEFKKKLQEKGVDVSCLAAFRRSLHPLWWSYTSFFFLDMGDETLWNTPED